MLTIVCKGEQAIWFGEMSLPSQYADAFLNQDKSSGYTLYRYLKPSNSWLIAEPASGLNFSRCSEAKVPAAARLAANLT